MIDYLFEGGSFALLVDGKTDIPVNFRVVGNVLDVAKLSPVSNRNFLSK